ncbi:MAG: hypothetical protein ACAF41_20720 [Leptolyngbya sp. BL-A-14]
MMGSPHETNGNDKNGSDLTQIRGIGVVRKRWLNSLGINTIADLAQASANDIEAQAKRDGRTLSRDELEEWIAQAQVHHVEASLEQGVSPNVVEAIAPVGGSKRLDQERGDAEDEHALMVWDSVASFKVAYQTRQVNGKTEQRLVAHHLEGDAVASWSDLETDQMQQWMRDRIEASRPAPQINSLIVTLPVEAEITQLRVMQPHYMSRPMVADQNSPIFPDAIQTIEPFALEVSMHFTGLTDTGLADTRLTGAHQGNQIAYRVQCLARHLATGETDCLADVTAHVSRSDDATYKVLLPSLLLQQPGTYRLKVLVTLQHSPAALGQFKVPMLQVV